MDQPIIRFPSTDWRTVSCANHADPGERAPALAALVERYLPPLRSYLITRWKADDDRADDLLQEFIAAKVLEQGLIRRADRERGKFRTFLLTALDRFVVSQLRRDRAAKRSADNALPLAEDLEVVDPAHGRADTFDLAWAKHVLRLAVDRMEQECSASRRPDIWGMFVARVLAPALSGDTPTLLPDLIRRFGFKSLPHAYNILTTSKRMFTRHLRAVVADYADDETDVDDELQHLRRILSAASA